MKRAVGARLALLWQFFRFHRYRLRFAFPIRNSYPTDIPRKVPLNCQSSVNDRQENSAASFLTVPLSTGPVEVTVAGVTATASPVPHAWPAQCEDGAMDVYASGPTV